MLVVGRVQQPVEGLHRRLPEVLECLPDDGDVRVRVIKRELQELDTCSSGFPAVDTALKKSWLWAGTEQPFLRVGRPFDFDRYRRCLWWLGLRTHDQRSLPLLPPSAVTTWPSVSMMGPCGGDPGASGSVLT